MLIYMPYLTLKCKDTAASRAKMYIVDKVRENGLKLSALSPSNGVAEVKSP